MPASLSHRSFPFDTAEFNFALATIPTITPDLVNVISEVDGFVFYCRTMIISPATSDDKMRYQFTLSRNPLVQLTAIVVAAASIAFAMLIFRSRSAEALAGSAASSFFFRSILSSQIHTFPTFLDLITLTACIVLLLAVLWRVFAGPAFGTTADT